ncbi:MAG: (Fe-S)-binding protein [Candidatus Thorarchaeota archaeon]|nr:MAG: (Fe-S)-binding protein [Candidatus Thorarchaeota archaeon]
MPEVDMEELIENLHQCRRCGICRNAVYETVGFDGVCPVWRCSNGFETDFMRGKMLVALALLDGRLKRTSENLESIYRCSLCGNCTEICGAEFSPSETLETVRQVLSDFPIDIRDAIADRIAETGTPYVLGTGTKRDWVSELDFDIPVSGKTVYFAGCTSSQKLKNVARSTARLLHKSGVDFTVLEEEPCCGSVLLRMGKAAQALENAQAFADRIKDSGAETVVVSCAGCMRTLTRDFPIGLGLELPEVVHIVDYAASLISEEKISPKPLDMKIKVTYHDPCHLGRELGVFDSPRIILQSIPGVELVEMEPNRNQALCCGAGGGLRSFDSDLAKNIAADRIETAMVTGASVVVTACPFCEDNLHSGAQLANRLIEVADVVELLERSLT